MSEKIKTKYIKESNSHETMIEFAHENYKVNVHVDQYDNIEHLDDLMLTFKDSEKLSGSFQFKQHWVDSTSKRDVNFAIIENSKSPMIISISHPDKNVMLDHYFEFTVTLESILVK